MATGAIGIVNCWCMIAGALGADTEVTGYPIITLCFIDSG